MPMEWTEWAEWFSYGRFVSSDVFCFDKDRISHEIRTALHRVRYCPCVRPPLVDAVLRHLPDRVKVGQREGWAYKESYQQTPTSIKLVRRENLGDMTRTDDLPERAQVVIIGGGVMGASVAYHLVHLGWTDVVLVEQGQLSSGTTWHAAGLVGQLRATEGGTRLVQYSAKLYSELEQETGLPPGSNGAVG